MTTMSRKILPAFGVVALLVASSAQAAFDLCQDYFPARIIPKVNKPRLHDLCFNSFAVLYSGESKTPVYTIERLNRARLVDAKDETRTNRFYEEARLPSTERATLADYHGSGYDRGHNAPAGDMPTPEAMAQSFSLANMMPQAPENNRGVWARRVEAATRKYVMRAAGDVYVFTGPVFDGSAIKTIGQNKVWVPTHLFKLVYDPTAHQAWAYYVDNTNDAIVTKPISYRELVRHIGIDLLPGVL